MDDIVSIQEIVNNAVTDITLRVAGIDLKNRTEKGFDETHKISTLSVVAVGNCKITIVYNAEDRLLQTIAEKMKRGPVEEDEEIEMYTKEYFNILVGHIVSCINRRTKSSMRFTIPSFSRGVYSIGDDQEGFLEICYESDNGDARMQSVYIDQEQMA